MRFTVQPNVFDDLVGLKWGRKAVFTRIPIRHSLSNPRNLDWGGWPDRLGWGGMLAWGGPRRPATPPPNQFYLARTPPILFRHAPWRAAIIARGTPGKRKNKTERFRGHESSIPRFPFRYKHVVNDRTLHIAYLCHTPWAQ